MVSRPPTMTAAEDIMRKFFWEQGKEYGSLQGELYRVASGAPVRVLVAYLLRQSSQQHILCRFSSRTERRTDYKGRRTDDIFSSRGGVLMARAGRALLHVVVVWLDVSPISRSKHAKMRKDREVSGGCESRTSCRRVKQVPGLCFQEGTEEKAFGRSKDSTD